jgi:hypothetical protein
MAGPGWSGLGGLLTVAGVALGKSQGEMGELLGVSRRTISRWVARGGGLLPVHGEALARALYPVDPELAGHAAKMSKQTLEGLGLAPKAAPAPSPRVARIVLWAAADALDASPRAVRPAIVAAFRAAREEGATLADVEASLDAMLAPAAKGKRGAAAGP